MKRILAATAATLAIAVAMPASAADFILVNQTNFANPNYGNFHVTYSDPETVSATLGNTVGNNSFLDNYFFAPTFFGVGSGGAVTNVEAQLNFNTPGLTITGYALDLATQAALLAAFDSPNYAAQLAIIQAAANPGNQTYFQAGTGTGLSRQLTSVPLDTANFYKISVDGAGTIPASLYSGNLTAVAVPEPATWAMMLAGFGAVGFAMRRRGKPQPKVRFAF